MELKHHVWRANKKGNRTFNRTLWNWNERLRIARDSEKETFNRTLWNWNTAIKDTTPDIVELLIVPYGIETCCFILKLLNCFSFNRTLWNWNIISHLASGSVTLTFNRTLWNWNWARLHLGWLGLILLIVPYGIETIFSRFQEVVTYDF